MPPPSRRFLLAAAATMAARRGFASSASVPAPQPRPAIGIALPLSGEHSLTGDEALRGILLAADAANANGGINGKPLVLVTVDTVDQSQAGGAVNRLITAGHANVLLGTGASDLSFPASAAAELAQHPFIELDAPAIGITTRGFKFLLRTGLTSTMIAELAAATLVSRFKGQKIGLLFNTGATGGAIAAAALSSLAAAKTPPLLSIGYPSDVTDLYDPVGRLKRAGAEVILHAAGPSDALAFFAAMSGQSFRPRVIIGCGQGYLLNATADALGTAFENTFAIGAPFYPAAATAIAQAYAARFGMAPRSADSLTAYVGAKLVFDTLTAASGDVTKLLDILRKTSLPKGALANGWGVAFDHSGQNTASFSTLQQWRGGKLVPA